MLFRQRKGERKKVQPSPSRLELSPLNFLHRNAVALGERPAVVHGDRRRNYAELGERCNRLANALRERGLERHERVAILAPNTPALLEAHYAVPLAGGVLLHLHRQRRSVAGIDAGAAQATRKRRGVGRLV